MSSESHGPPNRRDRQVPPSPPPPDAVAPEAGSGSSTLPRASQPWPRAGSPGTNEGAGSTAGFSAADERRTPFESRTVSMNRQSGADRPTARATPTPELTDPDTIVRPFETEWGRGR